MFWVPPDAIRFGLANDPVGTHGSRTIMLSELTALLAACSATAAPEDYRAAIIEENVLGKKTTATRKESARRLRELYGLDLDRPIYRAMRDLWDADEAARPLLALLCAAARDPILRSTGDVIVEAATAALITPQQLEVATETAFPARYNPMMLANIGRHAASSWQQSGHLEGRRPKYRSRAISRPASVAYAILLGHLCGARGDGLFTTIWARLLDAPPHVLRDQALAAARMGWIEYRSAGSVTEVSLPHLLRGVAVAA